VIRGWSSGPSEQPFISNPIRGESLDVALAYIKGKDGESEEAHANSSSLLYELAGAQN
jgi:hypothetical protein